MYSVALISNIGLLTAEALTDEINVKDPTFNEEPSPDNYEVAALEFISPPNVSGYFNYIGGWTFDDVKEGVLV